MFVSNIHSYIIKNNGIFKFFNQESHISNVKQIKCSKYTLKRQLENNGNFIGLKMLQETRSTFLLNCFVQRLRHKLSDQSEESRMEAPHLTLGGYFLNLFEPMTNGNVLH